MTSKKKRSSYPSVKFLRGSSNLETFTTNKEYVVKTDGKSELSSGLTGEEARQFYENLLQESNEKDTRRTDDGADYEQLEAQKPENISLETIIKRKHSSSSCRTRSRKHDKGNSIEKRSSDSRKLNLFLRMAQDGNLKKLCEVIRGGEIDIDATDQFGWTALMCASHSGRKACVKFLLKHGARIDLCNSQGQTAEDIVEFAGISQLRDVFKKQEPQFMQANAVEEPHCEICKSTFSGTRQEHNSSTVHLFNCQYKSERTLYHIPENNIGFQLMKKKGWDQDKGLGPEGTGRKFPVKTILKQDRLGLGSKQKDSRARITHFSPKDPAAVDTHKHHNGNTRVARKTSKRKLIQDQIKERKWEHDMRVYMNTE